MNSTVINRGVPRRVRRAVPIFVVAIASTGGFGLGILRHKTDGNLGVVARESSLDFGEVWESGDFKWDLVLENPTSAPVSIESLEASCGCTAPTPQKLTIEPASSAVVRLRMDLSPRKGRDAKSPLTDFSVAVIPTFRRGDQKLAGKGWAVRGRVHHALAPSVRLIAFGRTDQLVAGAKTAPIEITADELCPLESVVASADPPLVATSVSRESDAQRFRIEVVPIADLAPGPFACSLQLHGATAAGERLPPIVVKIEGVVLAPVVAIPDEVDFGLRSPGELAAATVRLQSLVRKGFELENVEVLGDEGEPLSVEKMAGGDGVLHFRKQFAQTGKYSAKARIKIRPQGGEPFDLTLPVRAYISDNIARGESQ